MLNSRKVTDLHPKLADICLRHIKACKLRGIDIIITSTKRDDEYQASIYAKGRTRPGSIVTNLKVTGAHGLGLAYDVVPIVNKVAIWNDSKSWEVIGEEGKKLGLVWGGDWKGFVDKPHFELTDGLAFNELRAGRRPVWFAVPQYVEHTAIKGKKMIPIHSLNKANCGWYSNCISGTFQYKNVTSSMLCIWGSWKRKSSTHDWLKQPETVLYQTNTGEVNAKRCLISSEITEVVQHAIGGVGLHNYDPKAEGFIGKYADVLLTNKHTAIGYDGKDFIAVYFPKANAKQMKDVMLNKYGCIFAIILDGGHIAAANFSTLKVNLNQAQNNMVQIV